MSAGVGGRVGTGVGRDVGTTVGVADGVGEDELGCGNTMVAVGAGPTGITGTINILVVTAVRANTRISISVAECLLITWNQDDISSGVTHLPCRTAFPGCPDGMKSGPNGLKSLSHG